MPKKIWTFPQRFPSKAHQMIASRHRESLDKYRAQKVHLLHEKWHMSGKLLPKPIWYETVKAHPPQKQMISPKSNVSEISTERWNEVQEYCHGLGTHKWLKFHRLGGRNWNRQVREASAIYAFPQEIEFPEDRLRERFLRDHPLERLRPLVMKENGDSLDNSAIISRESVVDVESVVRYQSQLMTGQDSLTRMSEEEAYQHACRAFYENTAKSLRTESTTDTANATDDTNPYMSQWLSMEEEALHRGLEQKMKELAQRRELELSRRSNTAV